MPAGEKRRPAAHASERTNAKTYPYPGWTLIHINLTNNRNLLIYVGRNFRLAVPFTFSSRSLFSRTVRSTLQASAKLQTMSSAHRPSSTLPSAISRVSTSGEPSSGSRVWSPLAIATGVVGLASATVGLGWFAWKMHQKHHHHHHHDHRGHPMPWRMGYLIGKCREISVCCSPC